MQDVQDSLHNHLLARHLDCDLHRPAVDEVERVATFYLWNLSGQLVGYQQYRPDAEKTKNNDPKKGRYFTHRSKHTVCVWGIESLHLTPGLVFVTEGIFDAARLTSRGVSAIAVFSNDPPLDVGNFLVGLGCKSVAVVDNDRAGIKLKKFGDFYTSTSSGKDLGECCDAEVDELLQQYGITF